MGATCNSARCEIRLSLHLRLAQRFHRSHPRIGVPYEVILAHQQVGAGVGNGPEAAPSRRMLPPPTPADAQGQDKGRRKGLVIERMLVELRGSVKL